MVPKSYYYLTVDELQHYAYMLANGYPYEVVQLDSQQFIVFALVAEPQLGIAWPTVSGGLDGLSADADTILEGHKPLCAAIMSHMTAPAVRGLVFPRYAN